MRILESDIQRRIISALGGLPYLFLWRANVGAAKVNNRFMRFGLPGQADITGIGPGGRRIEIEVKRPGGKLSRRQIKFGDRIKALGGVYIIAVSLSDAVEQLKRHNVLPADFKVAEKRNYATSKRRHLQRRASSSLYIGDWI